MDDVFRHAVAHVDHTKAERRLAILSAALLRAALLKPPDENMDDLLTPTGHPFPSNSTQHGPQRTQPALRPHHATTQRAGENPTDAPAPLSTPQKEGPDPGSVFGLTPTARGVAAVEVVRRPSQHEQRSIRRLLSEAESAFPDAPAPIVVRRMLQAAARMLRPNAAAISEQASSTLIQRYRTHISACIYIYMYIKCVRCMGYHVCKLWLYAMVSPSGGEDALAPMQPPSASRRATS